MKMVRKRVIPLICGLYLLCSSAIAHEKPAYEIEGGKPSRVAENLFEDYRLHRFNPQEVDDLFSTYDSNGDRVITGEELSDPMSQRIFRHKLRILKNK